MPIAQLNIEGRYPKYTWGSKPAANSVSAGTRVTITGWTAPDSDWVSDGTYWIPVNGRAVVHAPVLVNAQAQSPTDLLHVASVPGWQMPPEIASTPGLYVEAMLTAEATFPSSAQARLIYIGVDAQAAAVGATVFTSTTTGKRVWAKTFRRAGADEWVAFTGNSNHLVDTSSITSRASAAQMSASQIKVYYRGGNPDGSEILNVYSFGIVVGVGA